MGTQAKDQVFRRAEEWIKWYNYNKPNDNTPIEAQLAFFRKCHFGAFELIARLVELAQEGRTQEVKILLPNGVVLHEDIHVK